MPKGHREDCQCGVCKRMRKGASAVVMVEPIVEEIAPPETGVTLGSLPIGTKFRYGQPQRMLKKINNPGVVCDPGTMEDAIQLPGNTLVELLPTLPDIQQEMDA